MIKIDQNRPQFFPVFSRNKKEIDRGEKVFYLVKKVFLVPSQVKNKGFYLVK